MNQFLNFSLEGKVALVTGASYGIGFAIASAFAEQGAKVCFNDINQELVDKGMAAYAAKGIKAHGYVCDVTDEPAVQAMVATIAKEVGTIDILVNNAGIILREDAINVPEADWDKVITINQKVVFFMCQAFAKEFEKIGGGKIVNVASMLSYQGGIRVPAYTASKSAILGLTRALANEWASKNINVNAIAPGYMATNNTNQLRSDANRSDEILGRIPASRWGTPEDMAGAVVFLCSDAASYINGFTLAVDGGWLAR